MPWRNNLLLLAQRTLTGKRGRRSQSFRRHPLFNEALAVFELSVEATGEFRDALAAWKAGEVPPQRTEVASADSDAVRKRRRRRRRRGPRPGGPSEGNGAEASGNGGSDGGGSDGGGSDEGSSDDDGGGDSAESDDA